MLRVKITSRKRKKRVRFLDEVQADSSRPRATYTPPPTSNVDVMKFIRKKAAKQRQARPLQWWEKLASPTKQQWAYTNAYHPAEEYAKKRGALCSPPKTTAKQRQRAGRHPPMRKKKPSKPKTGMTLMELAQAFPNIAQQVCFHPKQSTFNSLVGRVPRSKQKVDQWL